MKADPRAEEKVAEYLEGEDADLSRDQISFAFDQHERNRVRLEQDLRSKLDAGVSGESLREAISDFKNDMFVSSEALFEGPLGESFERPDNVPIEDVLAEAYWSAPVPETVTEAGDVRLDFDTQADARAEILRQATRLGLDITYITGSGEGTYRGQRYDDEVVREAILEFEEFRTQLDETGFFDLRDIAWVRFREQHAALLGDIDDYWEWRESEVQELTQQYVTINGADPTDARARAEADVARYVTVTEFNKFYREQLRHQWVVDFPDLAREARNFAYFTPDKAEENFLLEQGGAQPAEVATRG